MSTYLSFLRHSYNIFVDDGSGDSISGSTEGVYTYMSHAFSTTEDEEEKVGGVSGEIVGLCKLYIT